MKHYHARSGIILFVAFAAGSNVLRLEATFLQVLADLGVSLECTSSTDT